MQCHEIRDLADSFLGEELLTETNHEILRHLDACPPCRAEVTARRRLRTRVGAAFGRAEELQASPQFRARLRDRLHAAAPTVDRRRALRFSRWWSLAATVIVAVGIGGGTWWEQSWVSAVRELARAAVGDHRDCALQFRLAERPIGLEEAATRYGDAYRAFERVPPVDVVTSAGPAHVLERHVCVYHGHRFVHVVLAYRDEHVSLLVPTAERAIPPAFPFPRGGQVSSPESLDGMAVVSFRSGHHLAFVAGEVPQADLLSLAAAISGPLHGALAGI